MLRVESVEKYKGKTYKIAFSDGEVIFIHQDILLEYNLQSGQDIPESAVESIVRANDLRRAKERALYLLDVRDYSYVELFKKLESSYSEDICFEVLNRLAEIGCINDTRYAEKLAEYFCVTKKFGYYRAKEQMRSRGLSQELIEQALAEYKEGALQRLCELIEKKYARYLSDENGIKKTKAALVRQGYSFSEVNRAIAEFVGEYYE